MNRLLKSFAGGILIPGFSVASLAEDSDPAAQFAVLGDTGTILWILGKILLISALIYLALLLTEKIGKRWGKPK